MLCIHIRTHVRRYWELLGCVSAYCHSQHDDRAGSEGGSGYYRRGGGGGRFRGGRGRWNRISFSPMRWEHDRFRSKSPTPSYEEGEGMADREEEAEEEENDEDFLRLVLLIRNS